MKEINKPKYSMNSSDRIRWLVRERDGHTCQLCGAKWEGLINKKTKKKQLDVHHIDENLEGNDGHHKMSEMNPKRLITLCHKCHLNLPHIRLKMARDQKTKEFFSSAEDPFTKEIKDKITSRGEIINGIPNIIFD